MFDHPSFDYRWGGVATPTDRLEYTIKAYLGLNAVCHDTAIAVWGIKRHYDYVRPITAVRYMSALGQSSDATKPGYHKLGLPLVPDLVRLVKPEDVCVGECDREFGFLPGPDALLGKTAINRTVVLGWEPTSSRVRTRDDICCRNFAKINANNFVTYSFSVLDGCKAMCGVLSVARRLSRRRSRATFPGTRRLRGRPLTP